MAYETRGQSHDTGAIPRKRGCVAVRRARAANKAARLGVLLVEKRDRFVEEGLREFGATELCRSRSLG